MVFQVLNPALPGRAKRGLVASCLLFGACLVPACNQPKRSYKPALLVSPADIERYAYEARHHPDADVRRLNLVRLAETGRGDDPTVEEAVREAALRETSEPARAAAIRALAELGGEGAARTLVAVLAASPVAGAPEIDMRRGDVLPPAEQVRWEAVKAMGSPTVAAHEVQELHESACQVVAFLLNNDPARDVRVEAARLLGHYASSQSLESLIAALRQRDFGVVYEAERSLTRLTGERFGHDHTAWQTWLATVPDPFAGRTFEPTEGDDQRPWYRFW